MNLILTSRLTSFDIKLIFMDLIKIMILVKAQKTTQSKSKLSSSFNMIDQKQGLILFFF